MKNGAVIVDVAIDQGGCIETLPYALKIANKGYEKAAAEDPGFGEGINLVGGRVTNQAVAESLHLQHQPLRGKGAA
jgi:alanine dehydrogenase